MHKQKVTWWVLGGLLVLLLVTGGGLGLRSYQRKALARQYRQTTTPTIFFHGYGSSYRAERQMANYARKQGVTNTVVRANVARNGRVTWHGTIPPKARNPIILVNLDNNKMTATERKDFVKVYDQRSQYVKAVVVTMQKRYGFKHMNLVAHSMGNLLVANYIKNNAHNKHLPQIDHVVAIAGHFNGFNGEAGAKQTSIDPQTGKPNRMLPGYRALLPLRHTFPKTTRVLNIYGDQGDGNDGAVPVASARSYRYLVATRARSYQEEKITGHDAQHSRLHESQQVDRLLVNFLWRK